MLHRPECGPCLRVPGSLCRGKVRVCVRMRKEAAEFRLGKTEHGGFRHGTEKTPTFADPGREEESERLWDESETTGRIVTSFLFIVDV